VKAGRAFYRVLPTRLGDIGMVWAKGSSGFHLLRICLPRQDRSMIDHVRNEFPEVVEGRSAEADYLARELPKAVEGQVAVLRMEILDLSPCTPFQRTVLTLCYGIPRGRVCTYGDLAWAAGVPQGARAVGMVMAGNPFPLVIPCHRVVRANGAPGGFGGGTRMKMALLAGEGVLLDDGGRVSPLCFIRCRPPIIACG
jgi:methylated-DNA-[protein]-cysteine S-methyltransferase